MGFIALKTTDGRGNISFLIVPKVLTGLGLVCSTDIVSLDECTRCIYA